MKHNPVMLGHEAVICFLPLLVRVGWLSIGDIETVGRRLS